MPTTRQETKKIEDLPDSNDEAEESPEEVDQDESSDDSNFELPENFMDMDEDEDLYDILSSLFTTEDGDNVCTALMGIKDALDTQNKILMKLCMAVSKKKCT